MLTMDTPVYPARFRLPRQNHNAKETDMKANSIPPTPDAGSEIPFIDYVNEVERLLKEQFGVCLDDATDLDGVAVAQEAGESPQSFVELLGDKYGMTNSKDKGG
jgi:hypothetical protein